MEPKISCFRKPGNPYANEDSVVAEDATERSEPYDVVIVPSPFPISGSFSEDKIGYRMGDPVLQKQLRFDVPKVSCGGFSKK